jgi:hypothetical protein
MQIASRNLLWLILSSFAFSHQARAETVQLTPVAVATAEDRGPQDGQFDTFTTFNLGSVGNDGFASFRTAMDFDLSSIPADVAIRSATLLFRLELVQGERHMEIRAYPDDGLTQLDDFARGGLAASLLLGDGISGNGYVDLTASLQAVAGLGATFAGLGFSENPANTGNLLPIPIQTSGPSAPQLIIDFVPVPEPSALWLLALGGTGLVVLWQRQLAGTMPGFATFRRNMREHSGRL